MLIVKARQNVFELTNCNEGTVLCILYISNPIFFKFFEINRFWNSMCLFTLFCVYTLSYLYSKHIIKQCSISIPCHSHQEYRELPATQCWLPRQDIFTYNSCASVTFFVSHFSSVLLSCNFGIYLCLRIFTVMMTRGSSNHGGIDFRQNIFLSRTRRRNAIICMSEKKSFALVCKRFLVREFEEQNEGEAWQEKGEERIKRETK